MSSLARIHAFRARDEQLRFACHRHATAARRIQASSAPTERIGHDVGDGSVVDELLELTPDEHAFFDRVWKRICDEDPFLDGPRRA